MELEFYKIDSRAFEIEQFLNNLIIEYSNLISSFNDSKNKDPEIDIEKNSKNIEHLLNQFKDILDKMDLIISENHFSKNFTLNVQKLRKHQDLYCDYLAEFNKLNTSASKFNFCIKKKPLFSDNYNYSTVDSIAAKTSDKLYSCNERAEITIEEAHKIQLNLYNQRQNFSRFKHELQNIYNRFPTITTLMRKIGMKKNRDSLILGGFIGICLFILLFYAFIK
ncbi:hypothetical protein HZS_82 [Henneguya salminicola]|nr:hypothetical protein HZS_82 [Henneguya salminicola]